MSPKKPKGWSTVANNAAKLMVFFFAEAITIAGGLGLLAVMRAGDAWWVAWVMLALFAGSFIGSYLLFPSKAGQPIRRRKDRRQTAGEYKRQAASGHKRQTASGYEQANIIRMLSEGFTTDGLLHLVRSEPSLRAADEALRPEECLADMADKIMAWAGRHGTVDDLLAAAERANPRMYAMHRPYHTRDREGPLPQQLEAVRAHEGYNVANIRRLMVQGFSADELHRLVRYEPVLKVLDEEFRPEDSVPNMADEIINQGRRLFLFDNILAAAERANPRRYAVHHPYHVQDPTPPADVPTYDLERISALFQEVFEAPSLYDFCRERAALGPVWAEISKEDPLARMIYRVLAYAERQVRIGDLLAEVQAAHPEAYERRKPYKKGVPGPADAPAAEEEAVE
ncbi:MAG: hypothetical protein PVJ34_15265 [Anaerolineae bacterium]|jgi:hypothetical protein